MQRMMFVNAGGLLAAIDLAGGGIHKTAYALLTGGFQYVEGDEDIDRDDLAWMAIAGGDRNHGAQVKNHFTPRHGLAHGVSIL